MPKFFFSMLVVGALRVLLSASGSRLYAEESTWTEPAKAERNLVVYGTMQIPDMKGILDRFKSNYPFLNVDYFRAGGEKLAQRIYTEVRAGRHLADVYLQSGVEMIELTEQGFTSVYNSPERKFIKDGLKDDGGYWTGVYLSIEALGYNTSLVPPSEVPKSYNDLLKSRWKGAIGLDRTAVEWYIIHLDTMGEEKGRAFMKKLAQQQPMVRRGHTLGAQLLAAGEYSLLLDLRTNHFDQLKSQGAPVGIVALGPLIPIPPVSLAIAQNPPHPNAGKLFTDFMLSKEGQGLVKSLTKREVARGDIPATSELVKKHGLGRIDWPKYVRNYKRYQAEFEDLFVKGN